MATMRPHLEAPLLIGVGAAFDFHAGLVPQAPRFLQDAGLEWAYRLAQEPRRLWPATCATTPASWPHSRNSSPVTGDAAHAPGR